MAEPFIGQIILVPYNFAPRGYAFCQGQILSIAQNTALFSLLGTTFGGNGQTTFGLPDLRGRVPNSSGQGPGLSNYDLGEVGGAENVTQTINQMPAHNHTSVAHTHTGAAHTHTVTALTDNAVGSSPTDSLLATVLRATPAYAAPSANTTPMASSMIQSGGALDTSAATPQIGISGGSQPFSILMPYLTLNYCIALEGIFPSRN